MSVRVVDLYDFVRRPTLQLGDLHGGPALVRPRELPERECDPVPMRQTEGPPSRVIKFLPPPYIVPADALETDVDFVRFAFESEISARVSTIQPPSYDDGDVGGDEILDGDEP